MDLARTATPSIELVVAWFRKKIDMIERLAAQDNEPMPPRELERPVLVVTSLRSIADGLAANEVSAPQACQAAILLYWQYQSGHGSTIIAGPLRTLGHDLGAELGLSFDEVWAIEESVTDNF